jgi:S1-C subfamily serine protease
VGLENGSRLKPPPLGWLAAFLLISILTGAVSGAVVALVVDGGNGGSSSASRQPTPTISRTQAGDDVVAQVASIAVRSVVTVINEEPPHVDENGDTVQTVNSGSGFIFDADGYVVTNEHVIDQPGTLTVVLNDGQQRPATLVSDDAPFTDLAVLRIPSGGLTPLAFADSEKLVQGQTVIAIGSALFAYQNSVTSGVISGLKRRYLREGIYEEDLIQTDAAVNTGNSGGPLVTLDGKVVGMVSNVVRRIANSDTVQGISFAISSRTIVPLIQEIVRSGSFPRPYFGIEDQDLDPSVGLPQGVTADHGALVTSVISGSPAAQAGIQKGDIILKVGTSDITPDFTFLNALALVAPTDKVPVQLQRGGSVLNLNVQMVPR